MSSYDSDHRRATTAPIADAQAGELGSNTESGALDALQAPSSEGMAAGGLHDAFGNGLVAMGLFDAQASQLAGVIGSELTLATGGVSGQSQAVASLSAMRRAMADGVDTADVPAADYDAAMALVSASSGSSLDRPQLERMERAFDHDFEHVRVHTDGSAARASQLLHAHAFTLGAEIFFSGGAFAPGSAKGDRLLAHELTHVVQSDEGRLPAGGGVSSPTDSHEVEAYANEGRMVDRLSQVDRELAAEVSAEPEAVELSAEVGPADTGSVDMVDMGGDPGQGDAGEAEAAGGMALLKRQPGAQGEDQVDADELEDSRGTALPTAVARKLAAALGVDPDGVEVHTDSAAAGAARALGAEAFALGADIFFSQGAFSPDSQAGQELLAHELVHVRQFQQGRVSGQGIEAADSGLEHEAEGASSHVAQYLDLVQAVEADAEVLGTQVDTQALAHSLRTSRGQVVDADADRAARTTALLSDLASKLGLGALDVVVDAEAGQRTQALGVSGLMEQGTIYLDPASYDPRTAEGRQTLAHEAVHVAQESVDFRQGASGPLAEAEAHTMAEGLAAGRDPGAPQVALPASHTATEGNPVASLRGKLDEYYGLSEPMKEKLGGKIDEIGSKESGYAPEKPKESNEDKVDRMEDMAETYADELEDSDAFDDDLRDACGDDKDASGPLSRVKHLKSYKELVKMYKGAQENEKDGRQMHAIFEDTFRDRGFRAKTEKAWNLVLQSIYQDAKLTPEEQAAKEQAKSAEGKEKAEVDRSKSEGGEGGGPQGGKVEAGEGSPLERAADMLQGGPVVAPGPSPSSFIKAQGYENDVIPEIAFEQGDYDKRLAEFKEYGDSGMGRIALVGGEMISSYTEGYIEGFQEGIWDTVKDKGLEKLDKIGGNFIDKGGKWLNDTLGKGGKMPKGASMKGVPFISKGVELYQSGMVGDILSGNITDGEVAKGFIEQGSKVTDGWNAVSSVGDNWSKCEDFGDKVGVIAKFVADLLGMIADALKLVEDILSTISLICFVVGIILIILGICFAWLGLGPLAQVGNILLRVGRFLDKIVDFIKPIREALEKVAGFFRVISALLVPTDLLAGEVNKVGEQYEAFGKESGKEKSKTLVEDAHSDLKATKPEDAAKDANTQPGQHDGGGSQGSDGAKKMDDAIQSDTDQVKQIKEDIDSKSKEVKEDSKKVAQEMGEDDDDAAKKKKESEEQQKSNKDDPKKKAEGESDDKDSKKKKWMDRLKSAPGTFIKDITTGPLKSFKDSYDQLKGPANFFKKHGGKFMQKLGVVDKDADWVKKASEDLKTSTDRHKERWETLKTSFQQIRNKPTLQQKEEIEAEVKTMEETISEAKKKKTEMENDIKAKAEVVKAKEGQVNKIAAEINAFQQQMSPVVVEIEPAKLQKYRDAWAEVDKARAELKGANQTLKEMDSEIKTAESQKKNYDARLELFTKNPELIQEDLDNKRRDNKVDEAQAEVDNLSADKVKKQKEMSELDQELAELERMEKHFSNPQAPGGVLPGMGPQDYSEFLDPDKIADREEALENVRAKKDELKAKKEALTGEIDGIDEQLKKPQEVLDQHKKDEEAGKDSFGGGSKVAGVAGDIVAVVFGADNWLVKLLGGSDKLSKAIMPETADGLASVADLLGSGFSLEELNKTKEKKKTDAETLVATSEVGNPKKEPEKEKDTSALGRIADGWGTATKVWTEAGAAVGENIQDMFGPAYGELLAKEPPHKMEEIHEHFTQSQDHIESYVQHYALAYKAYNYETVAKAEVEKKKTLATEVGGHVEENANQLTGPIADAQATEQERQAKIEGQEQPVKESDPQMKSEMGAFGDNASEGNDEMEGEVSGSDGKGAGDDMASVQDKGKEDADEGKDASLTASVQQQELLTALSGSQAEIVAAVQLESASLEEKAAAEQGSVDSMHAYREEHLASASAEFAVGETYADQYNAEVDAMATWAKEYREKRQAHEARLIAS